MADHVRLSIDRPVELTHTLFPDSSTDIGTIDAALKTCDAGAPYSINPEYAPFLCRQFVKSRSETWWAVLGPRSTTEIGTRTHAGAVATATSDFMDD